MWPLLILIFWKLRRHLVYLQMGFICWKLPTRLHRTVSAEIRCHSWNTSRTWTHYHCDKGMHPIFDQDFRRFLASLSHGEMKCHIYFRFRVKPRFALDAYSVDSISSTPPPPPRCRIYVSVNRVSIGSDNGLSPIRRQAIIQAGAGLLSIGFSGTNFSEF